VRFTYDGKFCPFRGDPCRKDKCAAWYTFKPTMDGTCHGCYLIEKRGA
jgi:hypothetical protein